MAYILLYTRPSESIDEYVVITDLDEDVWEEEFGGDDYELSARAEVESDDVSSFPCDRPLRER